MRRAGGACQGEGAHEHEHARARSAMMSKIAFAEMPAHGHVNPAYADAVRTRPAGVRS